MTSALEEVYLRIRRSLTSRIRRIVQDPGIAEDLVQETYIRSRSAGEAGTIEHAEAYLNRTAQNLALDYKRRLKRQARVEARPLDDSTAETIASNQPSLDEMLAGREDLKRLEAALSLLPERAQKVLILSRLEGWSNARIAGQLGISERTVFNDLKLALGHCHDALYGRKR
ncbi:RNA polymerase sigma factor [Roseibium suaedae]|uniref:RNA polymerase sigma-70 factor, ECF subfamily n=1 Tax=Roseibium suaedae TaxID=735517 RepID=A0A1M7BTZ8_9HYPH|nr:RNA polymerase sigma factor [Roseibium suaedae]SHL58482.1 RNA polymerase sigma-70 factor, ECF subfamily [Roseibium suaedae]